MRQSAVRTGRQQCIALVLADEAIGGRSGKTHSSSTERVADGQGPTAGVHLREVHLAHGLAALQALLSEFLRAHGGDVGQHLAGEGLVELHHPDVTQLEAGLAQHLLGRIGGA